MKSQKNLHDNRLYWQQEPAARSKSKERRMQNKEKKNKQLKTKEIVTTKCKKTKAKKKINVKPSVSKVCKFDNKEMKGGWKLNTNGANRYNNEFDAEHDSKSAQSKPDGILSSNDKVFSEHEGYEKRTTCEEFDDNSQNQATRSSTCSLPISDSSKFKTKVNNSAKIKAKKASAIDMPLQRNNIEMKCSNVSPIIEDDKEETIDEESNLKTPTWNNLFKEYINSDFKSIKDVKSANSKLLFVTL